MITKHLMVLWISSLSLALSSNTRAQKRDFPEMPAKVYDKVSAVTVKIVCDNGEKIGSGSIVGITQAGRALVLTACHVIAKNFEETDPDIPIEYYMKIEVKIRHQLQPVQATIFPKFVDRANDLALIATNVAVIEQGVTSYTRSDKVKPGQKVAAIGYPLTDQLSLTVGRITRIDPKYLVFDAKIATGSSGGPLVDAKGRMVGISSFIAQVVEMDEGYATNMNLVVSIVEGWLQGIKLKTKWQLEKNGTKIWPWLVGAGVAGGVTAFLVSGGGGSAPPSSGTLVINVPEPSGN